MRQIWDLQIEHDKNIKKIQRSGLSSADFVDQSPFHRFNNYSGGGINIEAKKLSNTREWKSLETLPDILYLMINLKCLFENGMKILIIKTINICQTIDSHRKVDFPNNELKGAFISAKQEAPQLKTPNVSKWRGLDREQIE